MKKTVVPDIIFAIIFVSFREIFASTEAVYFFESIFEYGRKSVSCFAKLKNA